MRHCAQKGFTLIEVSLFLAISGVLVLGIILSTQNSVEQQRYNDAIQGLTDFLRGVYSKAASIENEPRGDKQQGRTNMAIYGKLMTFGETLNLDGEKNENKEIFIYNVVGDADGTLGSGSDVLTSLNTIKAGVYNNSNGAATLYGNASKYKPAWDIRLETTANHDRFVGAVLVVRSPMSGTFYTYAMVGETIEVNKNLISKKDPLSAALQSGSFFAQDVDLCLRLENSIELYNRMRRNVRIDANAHNISGVELIPLGEQGQLGDNRCQIIQ